jgi:3-oxoacyl-[acyl-carrier protein] reductase
MSVLHPESTGIIPPLNFRMGERDNFMSEQSDVFSVRGQRALVTGASRGIGADIADALGLAGAEVIGTATTPEGAEAISSRFAAAGITGRGVVLDVADGESAGAVIAEIAAEPGGISILVNNAGITRDNLLIRMKQNEWDEVLQTNLSGMYSVTKACLKGMMKARSGRIINISSVVGVMGNGGQTNYAATKAGMIGFTKSLAREVGSRGITVNAIAPGFIETAMTDALTDEQKAALCGQVPLNRLGQTADIAQTTLFLASPAAAYITGETIHVNGGMYMI